jgi:diguanylate cyclase (GGDEF)-like protein
MGGLTIETVVMAVSGYLIVNLIVNYFKENFRQYEMIREQKKNVQEKMEILDSMVEVYDNVNLISFVDNTEMSLRDSEQKKHVIDMASQTHTLMNQRLKNSVMPDHLDAFLTFTNITTVRNRLRNKRIISSDFIDVVAGWFRAQYITVDAASDGLPNVVIYTTRNVEEDKRREQHLLRLSMTDEMTRLYNRRCYDEDMAEYKNKTPEEDFVLFSVDVNGLKTVNDTKGHAAGDELIKGAADCLVLSVGQAGKAYRTGGDEFMAIVHTKMPEKIREAIWRKVSEWRGMYTEKMTLSVGYAAYSGHQGATADELEHIADADMYAEKERYYKENGIDRRRKRS